jgi:hypothetical protein
MKKKKEEQKDIVIDAFKEGVYPQGTFKGKELSEIASTYNPDVYEAPILIGHVSDYKGKTQIPAFGWVGKVKIVGDHLKLVVSQFSEQLKEFIQQGFYKKVSAAFFQPDDPNNPTPGKWHLHHLAFLGGTPPAVKGLEGIAFAEFPSAGIEFAEIDTNISVDAIEEVGIEDTIKDLEESCATFISKIQESLTGDIDYDTKKDRCQLAAFDLTTEISNTLNMQWMFNEKLENIEEHQEQETEMSEKKSIKNAIIEMAQSIINKRKESNVDAKKEQDYQAKIAEQETKLKEFAEKERTANEAKLQAEKTAAEEVKRVEIKTFCDTAVSENRMSPAMRQANEPIMFEMAKANLKIKRTEKDKDGKDVEVEVPALQVFQEQFAKKGVVTLGKLDIPEEKPEQNDGKIARAEKYIKDHPTEFSELSHAQALRKALLEKVK